MKEQKPKVQIANQHKDGRLPQYYEVELINMPYPKQMYTFNSEIVICSADKQNIASKMISKVLFSVEKIVSSNVTVIFEVIDTTIQNSNPEGQKIADMGKLFARPISRLVLELDTRGNIRSVQNSDEILSKWNDLFSEISEGMDEQLKSQIKKEGDRDFENPLTGLKTSFLHSIFFNPIYKSSIDSYKSHSFVIGNNIKLISGEVIELGLKGETKYVDNETLVVAYSCLYQEKGSLLKAARKQYQNMIPEESKVIIDFNTEYVMHIASGIPTSIITTYNETIEGAIKYKQVSELKILV